MQTEQVLFALLRAAVCGQPVAEDVKAACTAEMMESVYTLANRHDLAHLAGYALSKLDLPKCDGLTKCQMATKQAIFRYMRLDLAYGQICAALEKAQIPFIPLKGSILRDYYPEPWMRTSGDIDILVKPETIDDAVVALQEARQCHEAQKGDHDVSLFFADGVHLELHYDTMPEGYVINSSDKVLSQVWEDAVPVRPGAYHRNMSDGMFYFYHFAHWAKHLTISGCGIRPVLDLWVLNHCIKPDWEGRRNYLEAGGLRVFAEAMEKLAEVWFSGAQSDEKTDRLARYVTGCDIYGTLAQQALQQQQKMGGKLRYAWHRIFIPYHKIKHSYPVLEKHRWLLPVCYVMRWCRVLFRGRAKHAVNEMQLIATASKSEGEQLEVLFQYLGIE